MKVIKPVATQDKPRETQAGILKLAISTAKRTREKNAKTIKKQKANILKISISIPPTTARFFMLSYPSYPIQL